MTGPQLVRDPIADAISAVDSAPPEVRLVQHPVMISSTGRPEFVALPEDATDAEVAELCGWILTALLRSIRERRPASRLLLPGS